ncbi:MAG: methyl-accepting chemotaxis protein [Rhodospirillum sp.]|nr:methyl-accepting chemotaxis protein [Rhodospirillum sp.]MCF8488887.1 methyl-accepting chemotaxis protein [Rhodospirillum sp.]
MSLTSIRAKLVAAFLVACFGTLVAGATGLYFVLSIGAKAHRAVVELAPQGDAAMEMKLSATRGHLKLEEILSGDTGENVDEVWALLDESAWYVNAVLKGGENDEGVFLPSANPKVIDALNKATTTLATFRKMGETRYGAMVAGTQSGAGSEADQLFDQAFDSFLEATDLAEEIIHDEMDGATASITTTEALATVLMSVIAVAAVLGTFIAATVIGRQVAGRVVGLSTAMEGVAGGSLKTVVPHTESQDEVGVMARSLLRLRDSLIQSERLRTEQDAQDERIKRRQEQLEQAVGEFDSGVGRVMTALREVAKTMADAVTNLNREAQAVNTVSDEAGQATMEASSNVDSVAAAIEELSASVAEISSQASRSSTAASEASAEAQSANQRVSGLLEAAEAIGEVVTLITDIASQTNLLALNATIEAARAGEMGKGFAVVANEVKNLANQTQRATDEIRGQVEAMQSATQESVASIRSISQSVSTMESMATSIASAVEEQGAAATGIARNAEQAAAATSQVSSSIERVHESARATGTASGSMDTATQRLRQEMDGLTSLVEGFLDKVRL